MGKIVKLKNANNVYAYPVTKAEAVYMEDNQTTLKDYLDAMAITKTMGPAQIVTFDDGANNVPVKSLILNIEPHQEGTGDPSPENIRPITGYTALNVTRVGKNLLNATDHESISVAASAQSTLNFGKLYLEAGTTYIISCEQSTTLTTNTRNTFRITNVTTGTSTYESSSGNYNLTSGYREYRYTPSVSGEYYIGLWVHTPNVAVSYTNPMVRFSSITDPTYESYQGTIYPISFSSVDTVYGGSLDVTSGELTVNMAYISFDGSEAWTYFSVAQGSLFRYLANNRKQGVIGVGCKVVCNAYSVVAYSERANNTLSGNQYYIDIIDNNYTTVAEWEAYLADNNVAIAYELATPITYHLTPTEMATLLGYNTIWMDAEGTLQVTYKADLATYISNAISSLNS